MPQTSTTSSAVPASRSEAFDLLRVRHPRFVYERFDADRTANSLRAKFHFRLAPNLGFAPETVIQNLDAERLSNISGEALNNLVFHLGLVEMLSYWKAACSPEIVVEAGNIDPEQIRWWGNLLVHGMGEFFYVNRIDARSPEFVRLVSSPGAARSHGGVIPSAAKDLRSHSAVEATSHDLVLTSGGKDSVLTLELLREFGHEFQCLLLNPTQAALDVALQAGCADPIIVRRTIDPRLLELNAAGYLNGHTPFSALLAFLGVTVAAICGAPRVIVSNERSAEEAAAEYLGRDVNHQYSKSFQFETAFRDYCKAHLAPEVEYFSLLRPLYELQIAELFARHPQYFSLFRSCNRGQATNSWCGRCPKCLFVFTALYPFVERDQMLAIFGRDLFEWDGAEAILRALLGLDRGKPFECVGTRDETLAALYLCVEQYHDQGVSIPAALRIIEETVLSNRSDLDELARRVLTAWTDQHHLPSEIAARLRQQITA